MSVYATPDLPWSDSEEETRRFKKIVRISFAVFFFLGLLIPLVNLPEIKQEKKNMLPPVVVQMLLKERAVTPPVVSNKKPVLKKVTKAKKRLVKRQTKAIRKIKRVVKPRQSVTRPVQTARQRAASVGLFSDARALHDLGRPQLNSLNSPQRLSHGAISSSRGSSRGVLTSAVGRGSGGMQNVSFSREAGNSSLRDAGVRRVGSRLARAEGASVSRAGRQGGRNVDAIRRSLDRNKGSLESLYNRATRKDPSLQGRVVFELTISAAGKVIRCKILSSELSDRRLQRKLVARLKMINFGREPVSVTTVSHTIDFFPA
ncbi:MAG: AgmX/PglI C-terminal domain-containing protein [Gammaproteobacteria bacterium]|nr:AgmX/PglI C-terminal domain-containing protein [Gammaproteobacteria bacterium]